MTDHSAIHKNDSFVYRFGKMVMGAALLICTTASGQEKRLTKEQELLVNINPGRITDEGLSLHSAAVQTGGAQYRFRFSRPENFQQISFAAETGIRMSGYSTELTGFRFSYTKGFRLGVNKTGKFRAYLGYQLSTEPLYIRTGASSSWVNFSSLSLHSEANYLLGRMQLSFAFTVPVAGFVSRTAPDASASGRFNGLLYDSYSNAWLTTWNEMHGLDFSLRFRGGRDSRVGWTTEAGFRYRSLDTDNDFQSRSFRLSGGLVWRFSKQVLR